MPTTLTLISSMATRALLADLCERFTQVHPDCKVQIESVGGVDAARRIATGEVFDVVALASDAIQKLAGAGHVQPSSRIDMVQSSVAIAVAAGQPHPDISTEMALKETVLDAHTLGYSTGPSGVQLASLFKRWGIADQLRDRIITAPPGVPVGALVARGEVALGFQQLSELMNLPGIDVLGTMPDPVQIVTTFSAAHTSVCAQPAMAQALLAFLSAPENTDIKRQHGMEPATANNAP